MATYSIYCDESCHLPNDDSDVMVLGAVMCPTNLKRKAFEDIRNIKAHHGLSSWHEIKWTKVSGSKINFYLELVNYFFSNDFLSFRGVVATNKSKLDHMRYNQGSYDLWYYKMYFYLLSPLIDPLHDYRIFIDIKDTKGGPKVKKLHEVLCNSLNAAIELIYDVYKKELMDKNKRPKLFGKFIYLDCNSLINNKAEVFWHLISLSTKEKFNILPCNNDKSYVLCKGNCLTEDNQIHLKKGEKRNLCLYRAIRINWISNIIAFANQGSNYIEKWVKNNRLYIRYQHNEIDYIVVLANKKKNYFFVSAYPVFYIKSKKNYSNDYELYKI